MLLDAWYERLNLPISKETFILTILLVSVITFVLERVFVAAARLIVKLVIEVLPTLIEISKWCYNIGLYVFALIGLYHCHLHLTTKRHHVQI